MSLTPSSTTEWLQSLPAELQNDIASSAPLLVSPLLFAGLSMTPPMTSTSLTAVTRHFSPLLKVISAAGHGGGDCEAGCVERVLGISKKAADAFRSC